MWKVLSSIPRGLKWPGAKPTPSPQVIWDDDQSRLQREPPSADPAPRVGACRLHTCGPGGGRGKDAEEQDEWSRQKAHHEDYFCGLDEKNNLLGAMGWGTAVVLGLQYVHFKGKKMYAEDFKSRCPVQRVFGMPQTCGLGTTTSKSVLSSKPHAPSQHHEEGEGHLVSTEPCPLVDDLSHQDLVEEIVEDVLSSCTYLEDDLESASLETTGVDEDVLTKQEQKQGSKPEDLLADAFREFETIAVTYRSVSENISGLEKAGSGEYREAMKHWRVASDAGYAKAAYNLGICYQLGRGTQKDLHQAAGYFRVAAERGHREAQFNLGMMYLEGAGCLKRNTSFATELLDNAAQQGLLQAQLFLGKFYTETDNENFEKAASYFYSAAKQKDSEGLYSLGVCYENGLGVECNECKAAELYSQAAKLGHTGATYNLAVFHENGLGGLPLDVTAAKELYKRASDAGHENAKHNLQRLQALDAVRVWQDVFEKQSIFGTKQSGNRGIHLSASTSRLTGREKEGLDSLIHSSTSSPTLNSRNLTANFRYTFNGLSRDHLSSGDALISSASPRFPSLGDSGVSFGNQSKNGIAPMFYIGEEEVKQSTLKCTDLYGESLQSSSQNFPSLVF